MRRERSPAVADAESFVHRVRKKYGTVDKDAIDKQLAQDKERMSESDFIKWGYPPGIYWVRRDAEERAKDAKSKEENVQE